MLSSSPSPKRRPHAALGGGGSRCSSGGLCPVTLTAGCLFIIAGFWVGITLFSTLTGGHSTSPDAAAAAATFRRRLSGTACAHYGDLVQQASERAAQLSQAQLLWVAVLVQEQVTARQRPISLLVFGYAELSDALAEVNCLGRTAFLENSLPQIDGMRASHPFLEVHLVHYRGKHEEADAFFVNPWLMEASAEVDSECFDVILIDGPPGTGANGEPARLESSHYALERARRCIKEGKVEDVVLLLHDSQRPMEQRIAQQMLLSPNVGGNTTVQALGTVKDGNMGDLAAFRVSAAAGAGSPHKVAGKGKGKGRRAGDSAFMKYRRA